MPFVERPIRSNLALSACDSQTHPAIYKIRPFVLPHRWKGPVYTGPDKLLHGGILFLDRLFTWIRASSVTDCGAVYTDPCKF